MFDTELGLEQDKLIRISQPLFYGLTFLTGATMVVSPRFAGTMLGQAVLAAIALVAAGLAEDLEDDWTRVLDVISVTSILLVVLFMSYTAARLSMV